MLFILVTSCTAIFAKIIAIPKCTDIFGIDFISTCVTQPVLRLNASPKISEKQQKNFKVTVNKK